MTTDSLSGNAPQYAAATLPPDPASPLRGTTIGFLGSSITVGAASLGESFVQFLAAKDGVVPIESAISGTTLAGTAADTYVSRLASDFAAAPALDAFVLQLSTNDSRQGKALGVMTPPTGAGPAGTAFAVGPAVPPAAVPTGAAVADSPDRATLPTAAASATEPTAAGGFAVDTTTGAIEHILATVAARWGCPVLVYTCLREPADRDYAALVARLRELQAKWHFAILDLYGDAALHDATKALPAAMADDAHPTRLGYRKLWLPRFEQALLALIGGGK
ncbi:SGNH/GDSL hydrolase family protein [Lacticaseibacillus parakribbianus]|uniref:SGNH/GDSL hydrolase family protein n=1 Tax=Lacticaseibacillus parakribbianus TaxID=2970927 RepID=UPI0021CB45D6|nr:GDSL-type esterase/lipase family protein [Lacticaseibacillus parakribbianus]